MIMDSVFQLMLLVSISGSQDVVPGSAVAAASVNFLNMRSSGSPSPDIVHQSIWE